jgi:CHAD domain-containing protein
MAKAEDIEIDPHEPYGLAAARIVRIRAEELFAASGDVLDTSDIERVHAMRVASRRLRAVLEIFAPCFPKREYRTVLRDVKRLADALGLRRDPDVHIDGMQRLADAMQSTQRPGIAALVETLRVEQEAGNAALALELERIKTIDLHARLLALADHAEAMLTGDDDSGAEDEAGLEEPVT